MKREVPLRIGKLGRPWGREGELTIDLFDVDLAELPPSSWLFLAIERQMVPFHYDRIRTNDKVGTLIRFDDLDQRTSLSSLVGIEVHATPELGLTINVPRPQADDLRGYKVFQCDVALGVVKGSAGNEKNPLITVESGDNEILIPFVEDMVTGIDHTTRSISVSLPDGLIDL